MVISVASFYWPTLYSDNRAHDEGPVSVLNKQSETFGFGDMLADGHPDKQTSPWITTLRPA